MKAIIVLLAALSISIRAIGAESGSDVGEAVAALKNSDVTWSGTPFGLVPFLSDRAEAVVQRGEAARAALLDALRIEDSFQVAHVVLTRISSGSFRVTAAEWNGLRVTLYADAVIVDPKQRFALVKRWKTKANKSVETTSIARPAIWESCPFAIALGSVSHG